MDPPERPLTSGKLGLDATRLSRLRRALKSRKRFLKMLRHFPQHQTPRSFLIKPIPIRTTDTARDTSAAGPSY
jgi:hypothetical protein